MAGDKCWCDDRSSAFCNVECRHIDEHRRYKAALEEIAHLNVVGGDEAALIAREVLATNQTRQSQGDA